MLAGWYAFAVLAPVAAATWILGPEFVGSGPGRTGTSADATSHPTA
ncbi:hypothetical protein DER29_3334 [Micromonospora sp. M71_S20]|nr:hypothetical protein DER29_3334 [Micromonospora sp. M71_S20]